MKLQLEIFGILSIKLWIFRKFKLSRFKWGNRLDIRTNRRVLLDMSITKVDSKSEGIKYIRDFDFNVKHTGLRY